MAGGDGPLRRRTAKSVEAAAAAAPLRRCSTTKRKASGKEAAAAASGRMPRRRASKEDTAAAEAEAEAEKTAAAGAKPKRKLPMKDVRWILAQEMKDPPEAYVALKRRNPDLVPRPEEEGDEELAVLYLVARASYDLQVKIPKLQAWVRSELNDKGYVEVDDDWFKRRAAGQAVIDREWPGIRAMMEELCLSEGDESESESDSDEEEEEGEDE